jgi:putative ABC transport system substrate-binding protein
MRIVAWLAVALCILLSNAGAASAMEKIAVILSSQEAPFTEALAGIQEALQKQGVQADFEVHRPGGDPAAIDQAVQKIKGSGARLVFTIGTPATDSAIKRITDIPIVACLVLRLDSVKKAPNATGVGLEFPLDVQFSWLQTILPNARSIGVIYNPAENKQLIDAAAHLARGKGIRLVAQEVHAPQDVPAALDVISRNADVLLGVADGLALSPQMARPILLFSFRNSIPLVGLSSTWVKAGALYSLDWDYADLGAQAGEMALQVLQGAPLSAVPPAAPRKALYSLNLKTAQQMRITFSEQVIRDARQTF